MRANCCILRTQTFDERCSRHVLVVDHRRRQHAPAPVPHTLVTDTCRRREQAFDGDVIGAEDDEVEALGFAGTFLLFRQNEAQEEKEFEVKESSARRDVTAERESEAECEAPR